jgi:hypothetical protein
MTYLIIAGAFGFGYLLPEFLLIVGKDRRIPWMMNFISGASAAAVVAGILLR